MIPDILQALAFPATIALLCGVSAWHLLRQFDEWTKEEERER